MPTLGIAEVEKKGDCPDRKVNRVGRIGKNTSHSRRVDSLHYSPGKLRRWWQQQQWRWWQQQWRWLHYSKERRLHYSDYSEERWYDK
jgi:hypothetical protein